MKKIFHGAARILAWISAFLFVLTGVLALILSNMEARLFNASLYKNALTDLNIYETFPGLAGRLLTSGFAINPCAENPITCEEITPELKSCYEGAFGSERYIALASSQKLPTDAEKAVIQSCLDQYGDLSAPGSGEPSGEGGAPAFFQNLTGDDWKSILAIILPPDELKRMSESVLDGIFAYLDGDLDQVTLSLVGLKQRLSGSAGDDLILQLVTSQPPCTELDFSALISGIGGEGGFVLCNPPEELLSLVVFILRGQLDAALLGIPDEAVIIKPYTPSTSPADEGPFGSDPLGGLRLVRFVLRLFPLMPLTCILLVTLFGVRSLKDWLRWWGIPFVFTGGIALGSGMIISPILNRVWTAYVAPRIPAFLTADVAGLGRDLAGYIAHDLAERIALQALLLLVFGLAAWISSYFIKSKTGQAEPHSPVSSPAPPAAL
jgi:hypothetical protein